MTDEDMLERGLPPWFSDIPLRTYTEVRNMVEEFTRSHGSMTVEDATYVCCKVSMELQRRKEQIQ